MSKNRKAFIIEGDFIKNYNYNISDVDFIESRSVKFIANKDNKNLFVDDNTLESFIFENGECNHNNKTWLINSNTDRVIEYDLTIAGNNVSINFYNEENELIICNTILTIKNDTVICLHNTQINIADFYKEVKVRCK